MVYIALMAAATPLLDLSALRAHLSGEWVRSCGQRVRHRRESFGWSQASLGALVGVGVTTVSKIENGEIAPRDYLRLALAQALGCAVEDLYPWPSKHRIARVSAEVAA